MHFTNEIKTSLKRECSLYSGAIAFYKKAIKEFEKKYNLTTHAFLKKFESGKIGDDADYFDWYAFAKLLSEWQRSQSAIRSVVQ
ncbi:MAG: hypothetical protein A2W77_07860 [Nitrospinae bacterium RIFCSPLOWO2_12_39_16]|nr:MAG: hypothetical protein A2W77_07860 [Nitrospinae bacterium RIFCSPLOWO2_12_39_16]HLA48874.1 hypothetical protein [Nitrospinota bacterium]